ncbi:MAG TPA: hypothetical protein VGZ32_13020 [Actinocrinis sp.]|jgi:galactan 5-O-arabinofuranosyltransferase|uniref:hypothetical protein n=1 Tax=Actinocrinis sp. TaxID=1920516 RepID=UPI002DDD94D7|nr:hypothetical protein [Actinocrinis sp.]HEV3171264.1 hypothetical protein [Actinocrinis sp.]
METTELPAQRQAPAPEPQNGTTPPGDRRQWLRRFGPPALEVGVSLAAAAWMLLSTVTIHHFAPLNRISQVSGLAALQVRFYAVALIAVTALLLVRLPRFAHLSDRVRPLAFATLPGLLSGFVGAGVLLALRGVPLPLNGVSGDAGDMERWVLMLKNGQSTHAGYPPLYPRLVWFVTFLTHGNVFTAYKYSEIVTTALLGPAAYLAWRLVTRPAWAMAIALVATAVLVEPYKSYEPLVLAIFVPLVIRVLRYLPTTADRSYRTVLVAGLLWGLVFGEIFILFSGWYYWAAIGIAVCGALKFPWRAWRKGAAFVGATAVGFLIPAYDLLMGLLHDPPDPYFFFGTSQDPAYISIWITDMPGQKLVNGVWPPPGELGGVGVFTAIIIIGLGVALALGLKRTPVMVAASFIGGAWLIRFHLASEMYRDHLVRYWPRASQMILYCLLILTVYAIKLTAERARPMLAALRERAADSGVSGSGAAAVAPAAAWAVGLFAAAILFTGMAGSASADKFMPKNDGSPGQLAWNAHFSHANDLVTDIHTGP